MKWRALAAYPGLLVRDPCNTLNVVIKIIAVGDLVGSSVVDIAKTDR
jgi:hypothetical protein